MSTTMVDYFAPLSWDDTFGRIIHVFLKRWQLLLGITTVVYLAGWIFAIIASTLLGADMQIDGFSVSVKPNLYSNATSYTDDDGYANESEVMMGWQVAVYFIECAIYYVFICVAHGASVWLVAHLYLEQYPSVGTALKKGIEKMFPLVGSLLLLTLIMMLPFFLVMIMAMIIGQGAMVVGGLAWIAWIVYTSICFYFVYPVVMVESKGPIEALRRSYELVKGRWCEIFGIALLWGILRGLLGYALSVVSLFGTDFETETYGWMYYFAKVLDTALAILFASISSVLQAVLYLKSRISEEKMDRATLAGDLGSDIDESYIVMPSVGDSSAPESDQNEPEKMLVDSGVAA